MGILGSGDSEEPRMMTCMPPPTELVLGQPIEQEGAHADHGDNVSESGGDS